MVRSLRKRVRADEDQDTPNLFRACWVLAPGTAEQPHPFRKDEPGTLKSSTRRPALGLQEPFRSIARAQCFSRMSDGGNCLTKDSMKEAEPVR